MPETTTVFGPVRPPVPDVPTYPVSALQLLRRWDRDSYLEAHGEQAKPYDTGRSHQPWYDPTASEDGNYTFLGFDPVAIAIREMTIPAAHARTSNLTGEYDYPKYNVVPTPAMVQFMTGGQQALTARLLTTLEVAEALVQELVDVGMVAEHSIKEIGMPGSTVLWNGENRRIHVLHRPQKSTLNLGQLLARKNSGGAGHPGYWAIHKKTRSITWVVDDPDEGIGDVDTPVPLRELVGDERLARIGPMGVVITRIPEDQGAGGGVPADLRAKIEETHETIKRVFDQ